ncbi:MAG: DUF3368 domain-containing protein [Magnetococcales bacterium]|nr:DUF3368 domain-containing protein [Magnetococcales bacterium]
MDDRLVVNASPLIFLGRVEHLWLLEKMSRQIMVPQSVCLEIAAGQRRDRSCKKTLGWTERYRTEDTPLPASVAGWGLGAGESQVVATALLHGGKALLDDRMGRRCAEAQGLSVIGTLGIVLLAKRLHMIPSARTLLETLRHQGLFLDDRLLEGMLIKLGE